MTIDGIPYALQGQRALLFAALFNARPRGLTVAEITDVFYGTQAGPEKPGGVVRAIVMRLRWSLRHTRFRIVLDYGRQYRMVRIATVLKFSDAICRSASLIGCQSGAPTCPHPLPLPSPLTVP